LKVDYKGAIVLVCATPWWITLVSYSIAEISNANQLSTDMSELLRCHKGDAQLMPDCLQLDKSQYEICRA
jgi:hypothetical protein